MTLSQENPSTLALQPNKAVELTGKKLALFPSQLTAGVRHEFHRSGKEVRQQQWSLAK